MSYATRSANRVIPSAKTSFYKNRFLTVDGLCDHYFFGSNTINIEDCTPARCATKGQGPIYLKNVGLMPNYSGHVPGRKNLYGETFGKETINAKLWLN